MLKIRVFSSKTVFTLSCVLLSILLLILIFDHNSGYINQRQESLLLIQTDFGYSNSKVNALKGIIYGVDNDIHVIDINHGIPTFNINKASFNLCGIVKYWPKGTVFLSIIDPKVGSEEKAIVARSMGQYFVTQDNGTLTFIKQKYGIDEVREIEISRMLQSLSCEYSKIPYVNSLYAYTAAKLASGKIKFEDIGPRLGKELKVLFATNEANLYEDRVSGWTTIIDMPFGNIRTNIDARLFKQFNAKFGQKYIVELYYRKNLVYKGIMPFCHSFYDVKKSEPLLYIDTMKELSIALNMESFARKSKLSDYARYKVIIRNAE